MIIDEITKNIIEDPDLNLGYIYSSDLNVKYRYILEKPAEYKDVVIAEYPETGGKDIIQEVVSPEVGHWEMLNEDDEVLPYPITVNTNGFPKEVEIPDILQLEVYHKYTEFELEEVERQKKEAEEAAKEAQEKQEIMDAMPGRVDDLETAQDDVILLLADIVGGAI